jgi:hypothetical protein
MVWRRNGISTMRRHGGALHASARTQHFLIGAALAALLLGLEEESKSTHRNAHVAMHPAMFLQDTAKRCGLEKAGAQSAQSCKNTPMESSVRPQR